MAFKKNVHAVQQYLCDIYKKKCLYNVKISSINFRKMFHTITKMFNKFKKNVHMFQKYAHGLAINVKSIC